jgi:hypothetical protein
MAPAGADDGAICNNLRISRWVSHPSYNASVVRNAASTSFTPVKVPMTQSISESWTVARLSVIVTGDHCHDRLRQMRVQSVCLDNQRGPPLRRPQV